MTNLILAAAYAWAADVPAETAAAGGPGGILGSPIIMMVLIFGIMYFLLIRPQSKKAKQHQAMLKSLQKGDRILTSGGLFGKVTGVDDKSGELTVEIAPQIRVKLSRSHVQNVIRAATATLAPAADKKDEK